MRAYGMYASRASMGSDIVDMILCRCFDGLLVPTRFSHSQSAMDQHIPDEGIASAPAVSESEDLWT